METADFKIKRRIKDIDKLYSRIFEASGSTDISILVALMHRTQFIAWSAAAKKYEIKPPKNIEVSPLYALAMSVKTKDATINYNINRCRGILTSPIVMAVPPKEKMSKEKIIKAIAVAIPERLEEKDQTDYHISRIMKIDKTTREKRFILFDTQKP